MMEMDLQSLATLFLVGLISTILVRTVLSRTSRPRLRLPPSPMALPVFGHLHLLGPSPHQAFHKLAARYGPLFYLRLGSVPHVVVSSPEIAKDFLRTHELAFSARPQSEAARQISYNFADFSFIPYGPYWKFMKKLIMSELFGSRMLDKFLAIRHDETQSFIKFLVNKSEARQEVHLSGELIRLTNNVISRMAISRRCSGNDDEAEEVKNLIMEIADLLAAFNIGEFVPLLKSFGSKGFDERVKDVHRRFDVIMEKVITEHEEARRKKEEIKGDGVKDILDMLLDIAEDENSEIRTSLQQARIQLL
uniref:Cytochrome P450 93A3-like n=1 Tax=Nelumbo nucifera TaxID=4432 RepID=A0A822Y627_NELNU|nr:TPA_asm: hypothetical protein HUJ06_028941 [Nelumbo nucifera]